MTKIKKVSSLIIISILLLISAMLLFACTKSEKTLNYSVNGNGSVVAQSVKGKKSYSAVPDKWFTFVGWYDGNKKYSEEETITLKSSTPSKLEARFMTSAKASIDRHLEGFYNSYQAGEENQGQYFNYNLESTFNYTEGENIIDKSASIKGYVEYGNSSQFAFELKDKNQTEFALYYIDSNESGTIYIQLGEEKYAYDKIGLITNLLKSFPYSSEDIWSLEGLINDEDTNYLINQYFGVKNSMGFINKVENHENYSIINISYHKILNLLKNMADSSPEASSLQKLIYALTCEYDSASLPEMILTIKTNYQKENEKEYVKDIEINFDLNHDYTVNFNGNKTTIPEMEATLKINSFNYQLSSQPNSISNDILSSFPEASVNMINVHVDGELDFYNVNSESGQKVKTVVDKYKIELDTDINPIALVSFKEDKENNYNDIAWENLGFLSFRVSLVPETDESALKAQKERHNGVYDYINILLDTENNGANVYFFLGLYTPNTLFTQNYIYNHSFNIPNLINLLTSSKVSNNESQSSISPNLVIDMLMAIISGGLQLENGADPNILVHDLLVECLNLLGVNSSIANNNLTFNDKGLELSLSQIRTEIRKFEKDTVFKAIGISTEIKLDKKLFGDEEADNITHMSISMNKPTIDKVLKDSNNNYLNMNGEKVIELYNQAHTTIVGVADEGISQFNSAVSLETLKALKDSEITLLGAVLSDGSQATTFINNKGKEKNIIMIVEDIVILSNNGTSAKIRVLLQSKDFANSLSSIPKIGETIYELTGVPYGLIAYETTVQLTA